MRDIPLRLLVVRHVLVRKIVGYNMALISYYNEYLWRMSSYYSCLELICLNVLLCFCSCKVKDQMNTSSQSNLASHEIVTFHLVNKKCLALMIIVDLFCTDGLVGQSHGRNSLCLFMQKYLTIWIYWLKLTKIQPR